MPAQPHGADQVRRELVSMMVTYRTTLNTTRAGDEAKQQARRPMHEASR